MTPGRNVFRLTRASWKGLRRAVRDLPPGQRTVCDCGGFVVYQRDEKPEEEPESGRLSHTDPPCEAYLDLEGLLRSQGKLR